jgi:hypothetical protein
MRTLFSREFLTAVKMDAGLHHASLLERGTFGVLLGPLERNTLRGVLLDGARLHSECIALFIFGSFALLLSERVVNSLDSIVQTAVLL